MPGSKDPHPSSHDGCPAVCRRLLKRSIAAARAKKRQKDAKTFCSEYNRFGRCRRGRTCPFLHDPAKVAVCTRFLAGTCSGECLFSHEVAPSKMPVCLYFLQGVCIQDNCPYAHVNVGKDAPVCQDFVNGFCGKGEDCTSLHTYVCAEFAQCGHCSKRDTCNLRHVAVPTAGRLRRPENPSPPSSAAQGSANRPQPQNTVPRSETTASPPVPVKEIAKPPAAAVAAAVAHRRSSNPGLLGGIIRLPKIPHLA